MRPSVTWLPTPFLLSTLLLTGPTRGQEPGPRPNAESIAVWPGEEWQVATPESQGLSAAALAGAAEYAQKYGGGSGCIVRHGYLVNEWGDPHKLADIKSATKGVVGATLLGLAVDAGLIKLVDLAVKHYPSIGEKPNDNRRDWLAEITIRHLATMTAGSTTAGRPSWSIGPARTASTPMTLRTCSRSC